MSPFKLVSLTKPPGIKIFDTILFNTSLLTFLITYSRSWALLEEPQIVQPLKNFQAFCRTRRFNTVFTRALHWSLSWATSIQSTPPHLISLRTILILSTYLRLSLPSGLFPSVFPTNNSSVLRYFISALDLCVDIVKLQLLRQNDMSWAGGWNFRWKTWKEFTTSEA
jgi:hypothetical protein